MTSLSRKLDIRLKADRAAMLKALAEQGIRLESEVLEFASSKLSEDWLIAWPLSIFSIHVGNKATFGIGFSVWAEMIQSLYAMRDIRNLDEQIRRLAITSHEALDTCFVLQVAGRYKRAGFSVEFEPNGKGCSDLRIEREDRFYVEVKRENQQEHNRAASLNRCSSEIIGEVEPKIGDWLEQKNLRLEVKFARAFSSSVVSLIGEQILRQATSSQVVGQEVMLTAMSGTCYVLLQRQDPPHFKGIRTGLIRVKQAGKPVQVSPENMSVSVVFDLKPNLNALKARIQKASRQLKNDSKLDPTATGFFALEVSHGIFAKDAILSRFFSSLPGNCLGIVLISDSSFLIPVLNLPHNTADVMAIAAKASV